MKKIVFEYIDDYCKDGKVHKQSCFVESLEECIELYGLELPDVQYYKILSVEEL